MKKLTISATLVVALAAAIGGTLLVRAFNSGGSGDALAAGQQEIFATLGASQDDTQAAEQPWLGVAIVPTPDGLTVSAVIADSPADKAGLQRGDVVTSIDGTAVNDMAGLRSALKDKQPGDTLVLSITRDGDSQDVSVTLEARPEPLPIAHPVFPELNGIPRDELFSHMLGGEFQFTDSDGNTHTATVELGSVTSVDADAKTIDVDLNSGGSEQYTITDSVITAPKDISRFESGDHVTVLSVDGDLRAVTLGKGGLLPGFGFGPGMRHGHRGGPGFGGMRGIGPGMDGFGPGIGDFGPEGAAPPADADATGL